MWNLILHLLRLKHMECLPKNWTEIQFRQQNLENNQSKYSIPKSEAFANLHRHYNIFYSRISKSSVRIHFTIFFHSLFKSYILSYNSQYSRESFHPLMLRATQFYLNRICSSIPCSYLYDKRARYQYYIEDVITT